MSSHLWMRCKRSSKVGNCCGEAESTGQSLAGETRCDATSMERWKALDDGGQLVMQYKGASVSTTRLVLDCFHLICFQKSQVTQIITNISISIYIYIYTCVESAISFTPSSQFCHCSTMPWPCVWADAMAADMDWERVWQGPVRNRWMFASSMETSTYITLLVGGFKHLLFSIIHGIILPID